MFLLILTVREFCGWSTRKEMSSSSNFMIWQATKSSLLKISENNITFYPSAGSSIRTSFSYRIIKMSNCSIWITTVSKICIPIRLQSQLLILQEDSKKVIKLHQLISMESFSFGKTTTLRENKTYGRLSLFLRKSRSISFYSIWVTLIISKFLNLLQQ